MTLAAEVCQRRPIAAIRCLDQIDANHHLEQFTGEMA